MHTPPEAESLNDRQSVLDAIDALLAQDSIIDEVRAKQIRKAVDALRTGGDGDDVVTPPRTMQDTLDPRIDAGLETLRERVNRQVERRNRDYDRSLQLMGEVEAALKADELHRAEEARHKLLSIMGGIPGLSEQRWRDIEKRLDRVRPRMRKLESWRHWGTTQVRQELMEEIRRIKDASLPPEPLAKRIKEAREQWQAWDKSGDVPGKELWEEFDKLCTQAYKPCAEHFKKLKQQRKDNLQQRQAVIDSLNARFEATDWKAPDWRALDQFARQAQRDFHNLGSVDFKHRKRIAGALDEALARFEDHLSRERDRSVRTREHLIAQIEELAGLDNLREALERLDSLKKQWTITVPDKRGVENRLWKRFQVACGRVHDRQDAERKRQDAERNANLARKQALIDELARAVADADVLAEATLPARLQDRWQETGAVPRKDEARLDKHWREAQQQFRRALAAAQAHARASEMERLAQRAALCERWEQATLTGGDVDVTAAQAEWDALPALEGSHAEALQRRFQQAFKHPDDAALSANLTARQTACVRLEVLLNLESPPGFQGERMAYQVERLNASLKKELDARKSIESLLATLLTTGAVPAAAAQAIAHRARNCLTAYERWLTG